MSISGGWVIPLVTSYLPHDPNGENELFQTRAFRGVVASVVALEHLYHLEHHRFPAVHNWPRLAKPLDPRRPTPAEFQAVMKWGDGSDNFAGLVGSGPFTAAATHAYAQSGSYPRPHYRRRPTSAQAATRLAGRTPGSVTDRPLPARS